jgi:transcriptional regulator with XRE-family HTH domain
MIMGKQIDTRESIMGNTIGDRIRMIRMVTGMNQSTFARQFGDLATSTISAYEKGLISPPKEALTSIAEIGGVTLESGGTRFDEIVGKKAQQIEDRRRMRDGDRFTYSPSAGDIGSLIQRLESFRGFIDKVTGNLIKYEGQLNLFPELSVTEQRLLKAFRTLPANKQMRIVEDTEEWEKTLGKRDEGKETIE